MGLDVLGLEVSYQENSWSPITKELRVAEVLNQIKSDKYKIQVDRLRQLLLDGDRETYNIHKRNLPGVTFCATFEKDRKKLNLKGYNCLMVLDVDDLSSEKCDYVRNVFFNEACVLAFWLSPSKEGIKGLISLKFYFEVNFDNVDLVHKSAFRKIKNYFSERYNIILDNCGSDTTRLCFVSYDPSLHLKSAVTEFDIYEEDLASVQKLKVENPNFSIQVNDKHALYNSKDKNQPANRKTIKAIISYLTKRNQSITHSYEQWYRVAFAIANTFTYDIGEEYFLKLSALDIGKFDEENCKRFLQNCYRITSGKIKFKSIVYFANSVGYFTKEQRERGSEAAGVNWS